MRKAVSILVLLVLLVPCSLSAAKKSREEGLAAAQTMVTSALSFWREHGRDASLKAMNDVNGQFRNGDFYVFVIDYGPAGDQAVCIARTDGNTSMLHQNLWATRDPNGLLYVQEMVKIALGKGSGWLDYERLNPASQKIEEKTSFVARIPGTHIFVGCGYYGEL